MQDALSCLLVLPCRDDHAGIRNSDTDAGNDFCECVVIDAVVEIIRIDVVRMLQSRHTDRVRAYAECCFQMLCVHQKACEFIAVFVQPEEDS